MKPSYRVVIPSYKRSELILTHTLRCLEQTDIRRDEVYVFVADKKEFCTYRAALPRWVEVVLGVRGLPNQQNFISQYFPEGDHILSIDDDISKIVGLTPDGKRTRATKIHDFIETAFAETDVRGMRMWGINSTDSNLEMKPRVSVGRIYIVGNFYGFINTHDVVMDTGECIKSRREFKAGKVSHERSLLMWERYGGVLKYRCLGVVSKYWGVPGGHQVSRTNEGEAEATNYFHKRWPDATRIREHKGFVDLVIRPSTTVHPAEYFQPEFGGKR